MSVDRPAGAVGSPVGWCWSPAPRVASAARRRSGPRPRARTSAAIDVDARRSRHAGRRTSGGRRAGSRPAPPTSPIPAALTGAVAELVEALGGLARGVRQRRDPDASGHARRARPRRVAPRARGRSHRGDAHVPRVGRSPRRRAASCSRAARRSRSGPAPSCSRTWWPRPVSTRWRAAWPWSSRRAGSG